MEQETFKPVKGYEAYFEISNTGKVKRLARQTKTEKGGRKIKESILKTRINNSGYEEVRLTVNGRTLTTFTHVLIGKAFIPNPNNKSELNHKNGIKTDNRIENLEWVTHSENMIHAYKMGLCDRQGAKVIDMCTHKSYRSIKMAAKDLNMNYNTCRKCLNGSSKINKTCLKYAV